VAVVRVDLTHRPPPGAWAPAFWAQSRSSSGRGFRSAFVQNFLGRRRKEHASVADRRRPRGVWTPAPGCPTALRRLGSASQSRASSAGAACRGRLVQNRCNSKLDVLLRSSIGRHLAPIREYSELRGTHRPRHRFDSSPAHHLTVQRHQQLAIGDHGDRTEESNRRAGAASRGPHRNGSRAATAPNSTYRRHLAPASISPEVNLIRLNT
jgi:hypothetical protein